MALIFQVIEDGGIVGVTGGNETNVSCSDSDGGKDYYLRGTASGMSVWDGEVNITDYCGWSSNDSSNKYVVEFYCNTEEMVASEQYFCPGGNCQNGACVVLNLTSPNSSYYDIQLISASDTSATIKVTNTVEGNSETKEVNEGSSKNINGLNIAVIFADETNQDLLVKISISEILGLPGISASHFIVGSSNFDLQLLSTSDTSATLSYRYGNNEGPSLIEISEGSSRDIGGGYYIMVNSSDENFTTLYADVVFGNFNLSVGTNETIGCQMNSDCLSNQECLSGQCLNLTSYCGNGIIEVGEQCDGTNLGNMTSCADFGFEGGAITCSNDCRFNVSTCYNPPIRPPKKCKTLFCVFSDRIRNFF